ncbi:MAG: M1 family metallopeptidase [Saprospiraceae bacterium]|nr:M1 family metallopeptidase [Saprospiraceae bacterium]
MNFERASFLYVLVIILGACNTSKILVPEPLPMATMEDTMEVRNLDTLVVSGGRETETGEEDSVVYHATATRSFDLLHTKLDLRFNWADEKVIGKAVLTLSPYFYPSSTLILDAKEFTINEIKIEDDKTLEYSYDDSQLTIILDREYTKGQEFDVIIDYTCTPSRGENGSAAITSDQGLFFINPRGEDLTKPQQIWTQGETEFNSRWYPTIDKPNERATQEILLTVDDRFVTLSNGILKSAVVNSDGTRTDHWVMDLPHAPYLTMIAVGEYAVEKEKWQDIEVSYYVEPEFKEDAKFIFAHTPEMLTFFSTITGVEYPWQKYAQIVVRDYVSGAMENTTSVVFGEFVQKHRRELIDNHNDGIVAHEMFHHWFGDYVTCESWSNLTLNEGFANYAEYLWLEHKYGRDAADHHRIQEIQGYLYQAAQDMHPLIDFSYESKENMFDAHSYNKGGLVLHMLRELVGDKAFFASLQLYLEEHAFNSVEVHDLRLAFEETTGLDLNWFFNQWYLSAGHPVIDFTYQWTEASSSVNLEFQQNQDGSLPVFRIPTSVDLYFEDGSKQRQSIVIDSRTQTITLPLLSAPSLVVLDPDRSQLAIINATYDEAQYRRIYDKSAALALRTEALAKIASSNSTDNQVILKSALSDPFWAIRNAAMSYYEWENHPEDHQILAELANKDSHSSVRAEAIYLIGELGIDDLKDAVASRIDEDEAYPVVAASIVSLNQLDENLALERIKILENEDQSDIVAAISLIYGSSGDTSKLTYFERQLRNVEGLPALDFYQSLDELLSICTADTKITWVEKLGAVATDTGLSPYTKISATRSMISILKEAEKKSNLLSEEQISLVRNKIDAVIEKEENPQIISIYQSFMSS